jgi:phenylalanyl-tRNA synthetase beta chain
MISNFGIDPVLLENPNSVLMNSMRVNLLYGMQTTLVNNVNALGKDVSLRLFEIGKTFNNTDKKFIEEQHICFALSGSDDKKSFNLKERNFDIFEIKGELEILFSKLNIENNELIYYNEESGSGYFDIKINNASIGKLYILNNRDNPEFEIENDVFIAELDTNKLFANVNEERKYKEISKYPSAKRDLALLLKSDLKYKEVEKVIKESGGTSLKKLDLFDVFTDKKLGDGNRSMTFSLEVSAADRTLTDEEVNKIIEKIIKNLNIKLGVTLRAN